MKCKRLKLQFIFSLLIVSSYNIYAQRVDYSVATVPEETGIEFLKITTSNDYVCMPLVKRNANNINWFSNRIIDIINDGSKIAYLSFRNNSTNIFIKELGKQSSSIQRTNRTSVIDFSFSPDGKFLCFSEKRGTNIQIFQTNALDGYVCRQITNGAKDYSPIYSYDLEQIYFARQEEKSVGIWSYNIKNNFLTTHTIGMNPYPTKENNIIYCTRSNNNSRSEIWRINSSTGVEECVISDINRSFTTPTLSPNGKWLLFVGSSVISNNKIRYLNTDIFIAKTDGTGLQQLTYHAADDLSPIWSKDGKYIYFISQRGDSNGTANIWRIKFNY